MPTATVTLPNGTKVTIEGDAAEVKALLEALSAPGAKDAVHAARGIRREETKATSGAASSKAAHGPTGYIKALKEEGYFNQKRTISDVQEKLEENAHIYDLEHLSTPLVRLVRSRVLRRIKEGGVWKYVNS